MTRDLVALSILTHIPVSEFLALDDRLIATYLDVLQRESADGR